MTLGDISSHHQARGYPWPPWAPRGPAPYAPAALYPKRPCPLRSSDGHTTLNPWLPRAMAVRPLALGLMQIGRAGVSARQMLISVVPAARVPGPSCTCINGKWWASRGTPTASLGRPALAALAGHIVALWLSTPEQPLPIGVWVPRGIPPSLWAPVLALVWLTGRGPLRTPLYSRGGAARNHGPARP